MPTEAEARQRALDALYAEAPGAMTSYLRFTAA